ncbi:MAG: hypothetical protein MPK03_04115, partial [Alphaproteobacteria bacterium]|nr:hypothetical protein [Alphaproteobacteria bacterium]
RRQSIESAPKLIYLIDTIICLLINKKTIYLIDPLNSQIIFLFFLRASPHPSAGIARLSGYRECLSQSLTNAKDRTSSVLIKAPANARGCSLEH